MIGALIFSLALGAPPKAVHWERSLDEALRKARVGNKPVMLDFWAEWCDWCHRLDQTTYVDPRVQGLLQGFVTAKINMNGNTTSKTTASQYQVDSLPTILFLSPHGTLLLRVTGFQGPSQFPGTLQEAHEVADHVIGWESAIAKNPDDAEALSSLGSHLFDLELLNESEPLLERARAHDEQRPTRERKQTRTVLGVIAVQAHHNPEAETVLKEALALPAADEYDAKTLFILGRVYLKWGRQGDARACLKSIVESHASSALAPKARDILLALDRKP